MTEFFFYLGIIWIFCWFINFTILLSYPLLDKNNLEIIAKSEWQIFSYKAIFICYKLRRKTTTRQGVPLT